MSEAIVKLKECSIKEVKVVLPFYVMIKDIDEGSSWITFKRFDERGCFSITKEVSHDNKPYCRYYFDYGRLFLEREDLENPTTKEEFEKFYQGILSKISELFKVVKDGDNCKSVL